ncbi:MAG: anti-sigma factor, partial [Inquilinus sp.]|nr:anti-sigma factor [Inquilinus sp.]
MTELNADFTQPAFVRTAELDWQPSPSPSVHRKRLDLAGPAEAGRV